MQTQNKNNPISFQQVELQTSPVSAQPQLSETRGIGHLSFSSTRGPLLLYWIFCLAVGLLLLHDYIFSWRIPAAWITQPFFLALAVVVTIASQVGYWQVARNDGRPLKPLTSFLFVLCNGPIECFMFLAMYQLLFSASKLVFGGLDFVNVGFGILGFVFYSGLIHAVFWARLLPRHFSAEPRLQTLRRLLTPIQSAIVLVWCLYFYQTGDIWTPVILHSLMDTILMVRVRPPVFAS